MFLVSFAVLTVGGVLTDTLGPGWLGPGWLVGIAAAIDAFRGAQELSQTGVVRLVGPGLWVLLAVSLALTGAGVINVSEDPASDGRLDSDERYELYEDCLTRGLGDVECGNIYLEP